MFDDEDFSSGKRPSEPLWKSYLSLIGIPFAALSVVNLISRLGEVQLNGVFKDFIQFYRESTHRIVSFAPEFFFDLDVPPIVKDYWVISFWLVGIQMFATLRATPDFRRRLPLAESVGKWVLILFLGYSMLGILIGCFTIGGVLFSSREMLEKMSDGRANMVRYGMWLRRSFLASIVGIVLFFVLNAYA